MKEVSMSMKVRRVGDNRDFFKITTSVKMGDKHWGSSSKIRAVDDNQLKGYIRTQADLMSEHCLDLFEDED